MDCLSAFESPPWSGDPHCGNRDELDQGQLPTYATAEPHAERATMSAKPVQDLSKTGHVCYVYFLLGKSTIAAATEHPESNG